MRLLNTDTLDEKLSKRLEQHKKDKELREASPRCKENGACFARSFGKCIILTDTKFGRECPFKKPRKEITNGKRYGYRDYII